MTATTTIVGGRDTLETDEVEHASIDPGERAPRSPAELSRRRFVIAVVVGTAIVAVPLLWVAWDLWSGSVHPLRSVPYDNFYELQARAMFHGHLDIAPGRLGIEGFLHDGRQYTYFGLFPSLVRMPILLVTSKLDGQLTAPSILLAWTTTAVFSSLMLWRIRILMRGKALLGRAEAASYGVLMATIMGGSVLLYLSATPFIYSEDFAWSVPLTIGSLFALLGVLERPSTGRVVATGVLILFTNLDRTPAGYACVIAAGLVAIWFALGRGGPSGRRWALPLAGAALVGFLVGCAVTYAKFGIPIGLPMADQVWASLNAHRRYFLKANGGKAFSFAFLPSTLKAYLQPFGLHVSALFPWFATPTAPAATVGHAVLDQTYPTASIPATMPLLFLLGCWGAITAFRPRGPGMVRLTRIILVGAAAATAGVLLWGYIAERYMADFMPLLVTASFIGLIDVWRRLENAKQRPRSVTLGVLTAAAVYCIAVNVAIAAGPVPQWSLAQTERYVSTQLSLQPSSLASTVRQGDQLPYWAPTGTLFIVGHCSGLYLSSGETAKDVPGQQIEHYTWMPVEQAPDMSTTLSLRFNQSPSHLTGPVPVLTYGKSTLVLEPAGGDTARFALEDSGTSISWPPGAGWAFHPSTRRYPYWVPAVRRVEILPVEYQATVTIDPNLHSLAVTWYGSKMVGHYIGGSGPAVVKTTKALHGTSQPVVSVAKVPEAAPSMNVCHSLLAGR